MTDKTRRLLFLFPGQGAQYNGIGSDLIKNYPTAADIYDAASSALGYDMVRLCNPESSTNINLTVNAQPVLLTHSIACLTIFLGQAATTLQATYACGHSLGEYSALVMAESLKFESALKLVLKRGELMGRYGKGEMVAVPMNRADLENLTARHHCAVAACNLPEQTVVGGSSEDLDKFTVELKHQYPQKTAIRLKTEGAFHTYYMVKAAREFRPFLEQTEFKSPKISVTSNYTGDFHPEDINQIRANLFFQLFHPVMYYENLMTVANEGVDAVIEFGGGLGEGNDPASKRPNLAGTIMRAYRRLENRPKYFSVINIQSLEKTLSEL